MCTPHDLPHAYGLTHRGPSSCQYWPMAWEHSLFAVSMTMVGWASGMLTVP